MKNYTLISIIVKCIFCKNAKAFVKLVFYKIRIYNTMCIEKQNGSDDDERETTE